MTPTLISTIFFHESQFKRSCNKLTEEAGAWRLERVWDRKLASLSPWTSRECVWAWWGGTNVTFLFSTSTYKNVNVRFTFCIQHTKRARCVQSRKSVLLSSVYGRIQQKYGTAVRQVHDLISNFCNWLRRSVGGEKGGGVPFSKCNWITDFSFLEMRDLFFAPSA